MRATMPLHPPASISPMMEISSAPSQISTNCSTSLKMAESKPPSTTYSEQRLHQPVKGVLSCFDGRLQAQHCKRFGRLGTNSGGLELRELGRSEEHTSE